MPFGPLVTLILLTYLLFLGVILTFWFALSPGRNADGRETKREDVENEVEDAQRLTPAERRRAPSVYTRDEVRGANARGVGPRGADAKGEEIRVSADSRSAETGANVSVAKSTSKKKNDAFEDFIRSKNDDFEF